MSTSPKLTTFRIARAGTVLGAAASLAIATWLLTGCGPQRRGEPLIGAKPPPPNEQVALGEQAFMRYCHQCHPGGAAGLGPGINDKPLPGPLIKTQVRIGGGAMPAFPESQISDRELDGIVAYLAWMRTLQPRNR